MAISALPVDGLINRLIQQNQRPAARPSGSSSEVATPQDQVSISNQAKAHASDARQPLEAKGEADAQVQTDAKGITGPDQTPSPLESKLLDMYKALSGGTS